MDKQKSRELAYNMIRLVRYAVNGVTPEKRLIERLDLDNIYNFCEYHKLTACAAYTLEAAGVSHHDFIQAKEKGIRRNILFDAERFKLVKRFEQEQISYLTMKGVLIKEWYPQLGMRQMADVDFLVPKDKREKSRTIMKELGFEIVDKSTNVDGYIKHPIYNFEIHESFFTYANEEKRALHDYFEDISSKLIKDEDNDFGYHLSNEDFYIYMTAHEYKHYFTGGTGVRSLLDTYIFVRKFGDVLDWDYIKKEMGKIGIAEYEEMNRELAMKVFGKGKINRKDAENLDYYIFSGTYGNVKNNVQNHIQSMADGNKKQYILRRLFPPIKHYKTWYPWAYEHKILLPAAWTVRLVKALTQRRKNTVSEIKILNDKR